MLTQLKNGDWINLAQVSEVKASCPFLDSGQLDVSGPWNVIVLRTFAQDGGGIRLMHTTIRLPSQAEAEAYRNELATLVNSAKTANDMMRWILPNMEGLNALAEDIRRAMKSSQEDHVDDIPPKSWHDDKPLI